MIDIVEILTHWYAGRSQHELAASLGVDRKTLRKYTAPAVAAGWEPGGPPMAEADWRALVCEWFGCGSSGGTSCGPRYGVVDVAGLVDALLLPVEVVVPVLVEVVVAA